MGSMAETMFVGTLLSVLTMLVAGAVALVRHFTRKAGRREFISAHPVGQHRLNHPGSDRWTGGDRKDDL